jgi:hypothetical protein
MPHSSRQNAGRAKPRLLAAVALLGVALLATLLSTIAGAATVTAGASADTSLSSAAPDATGGSAALTVDGAPVADSFLRFSVSGLPGPVQRATLNLFATDGSADGPMLYAAATSWNERKVTWNTRPARTGAAVADVGVVAPGTWVSFDVTGLVTGNGTYAFDLATASADETVFSSREAKTKSQRPQLVIQSTTTTTVDTTPPQTTITSGPATSTASTGATFAFSASEPARFACSLDGAAATACTSPVSYSGLATGPHSFSVAATDLAGNADTSPATWSWSIAAAIGDPRSAPLAPASGALFGVHFQVDNNAPAADQQSAILGFESALGRTMAIDHHYDPWGDVFPTWRDTFDLAGGRIPMISWGKVLTTDVTAGRYDTYIADRADGVRGLGQPVFIRWMWEMDGNAKASYVVSPADYIAAWKHIRAIFAARGATNAVWVWCPNASAFGTGEAQTYYPGDDQVDWVCADGYNWYPDSGRSYESFESKFTAFNDWAVSRGKPAMAGEYASQEMETGRRAQWINDARTALETRLTGILAVNWFHALTSTHDWRLTPEPDAFEAFRQMGFDPFFNP